MRGVAAQDSPSSSSSSTAETVEYLPVLDFTRPETMDQVDRLDDAIMGGISTSAVIPGDGYAKWGGVCRTDGGYVCLLLLSVFVLLPVMKCRAIPSALHYYV